MKIRYSFLALFVVTHVMAGITYEKDKNEKPPHAAEKAAEDIKKATQTADISGVNARLRIEGASFRPFILYLAQTEAAVNVSNLQKKTIDDVHGVIERDLKIVNGFSFMSHKRSRPWEEELGLLKQKGAEGASKITVSFHGDQIKATIEHKNLISGKRTLKSFAIGTGSERRLSHLLAQSIYEEYIGAEDIFLLQIAAVKRVGLNSQIVLLDFDGFNETKISDGPWHKTCPTFSPKGNSVIYTVITPNGQGIVEQEIGSKKPMQFRTKQSGVNLDARVYPNDSGMLVTLSFESLANIYRTTRTGKILGKFTSSLGMNLTPTISPDGKEVAFVSTRGETPQIYVQPLASNGPATRLTFQGSYNQTPQFSPDGKYIAFTGRDERKIFDVFLLERASGRVSRITQDQGRNEEPHFTPSGRFVIFTSEREAGHRRDIYIASLTGDHQMRLSDAKSNMAYGYFSPVIRPKQGN